MATYKYFNGTNELKNVYFEGRKQFGQPVDFVPVWTGSSWTKNYVPVERTVRYKSNPSKHICDTRCMFAKGRTMNCECSCGGKNHGNGGFQATAA